MEMLRHGPHMAAVRKVQVHGGHERQVERKVAPVALRLERAPLARVQCGVRADHCPQLQSLKRDLGNQIVMVTACKLWFQAAGVPLSALRLARQATE